jgi:hypothetical protein
MQLGHVKDMKLGDIGLYELAADGSLPGFGIGMTILWV